MLRYYETHKHHDRFYYRPTYIMDTSMQSLMAQIGLEGFEAYVECCQVATESDGTVLYNVRSVGSTVQSNVYFAVRQE
jgi:hypothetical protein